MTDMYENSDFFGEQTVVPADFVYRDDRSRPEPRVLMQPQDFAYTGRPRGINALRRMAGDAAEAIAALRRPTSSPAQDEFAGTELALGSRRSA